MKDASKGNPLLVLFGMSWRYAPRRQNIIWYWLMFFVANIFSIVCQPLVLAHVMDVVQKEGVTHENFGAILFFLGSILIIDILFWAFHGPARLIERANAFGNRMNYRKYLLGGVMSLPLRWHSEHHSGDTIDKVNKGTDALFDFSEQSFEVIYSIVQLIGSLGMLMYFSPSAGIVVVVMLFISAGITVCFDRVLIPQYKQLSKAENGITEGTFDAISNITTVIILRVERLVFQSIMHKVEKPFELFKRNNLLNELKWCATSLCSTIMLVSVMALYFWQNLGVSKGIMASSVYLLLRYLDKISEVFFRFTGLYSTITKQCARVQNAEILAQDFRPEGLVNHVLPKAWQELRIENLNFSYHTEGETDLHLTNISLSLRRGEKIAFVGGSGSGKTTLLKLIRGLYIPKSLRLRVDGRDIAEGFDGINQAIALVPQAPEIFATTIRDNITLGAEYSPEMLERYMRMACFTEVLEALPRGLDSSTKEKGVNLSTGQSQRLALARGLLACDGKDIVLLDEPTSSLDKKSEADVYRNIFEAFPGKTVVSSIHQLHLLPHFDRVYMFERGRIVGAGTHTELLATCPEFQVLWGHYNQEVSEE